MRLLDPVVAGVRVVASTPLAEVEALALGETTIVVVFEAFRDGRGMSLASVLRERGFDGELIAAGDLLPDQARHLARSGFDAVELRPETDRATWLRMLNAFTTVYQPSAGGGAAAWNRRGGTTGAASRDLHALAERLNRGVAQTGGPAAIVKAALDPALGLRTAALSSFGAESATLLDFVAQVDVSTPVLFLDTGQHFFQTLSYRRSLSDHLGLSDVRILTPDPLERQRLDPKDDLWSRDADGCCELRKVRPLARAVEGFDALITGRKRYQNAERAALKPFEVLDGTLRINPLADWTADDVAAHAESRGLPSHMLVAQGYASIGCWPCTRAVESGEDQRAGRWSGVDKVECGIHLGGRLVAATA